MSQDTLKERASALLELADIRLNGKRPTDLRVHDERLYARVFAPGSLGLGESYIDGWWDANDLPTVCTRLLTAGLDQELKTLDTLLAHLKGAIPQPAARRARVRGRQGALRPRQRSVPRHAEQADGLLLRLLGRQRQSQ